MADELRIGTPLSKSEARIAVMRENPDLYNDYRALRYGTMQDVAKGMVCPARHGVAYGPCQRSHRDGDEDRHHEGTSTHRRSA